MTLYLSTNQNVIIPHPRGDGHELTGQRKRKPCVVSEQGMRESQKLCQVVVRLSEPKLRQPSKKSQMKAIEVPKDIRKETRNTFQNDLQKFSERILLVP